MDIKHNLEQVGLYFKDKIQKGDYTLLDNYTPYSSIRIDGEYEFCLSAKYLENTGGYYCHVLTSIMFSKYLLFNQDEAREVVENYIAKKEELYNEINKSNLELQIESLQEQLEALKKLK
jgi:hypothetical protein